MEQLVPELKRSLQAQYGHLMIRWYEAVDWTEPLIVGALASHALLFVAVFATRKRLAIQAALFAAIVLLVAVTEPLNSWGQRNWRLFATQNYFDPRGVFMGLFYAGPLLAAGFFQLLLSMKRMVEMIVIVKRAEFREHFLNKAKQTPPKPKHE